MAPAIISGAGTMQLIGLALIVVMVMVLGYKIATGGAKGFAFALAEIAGLLVALWLIARPNDAITLLLTAVGGVQAPTLPGGGNGGARPQ